MGNEMERNLLDQLGIQQRQAMALILGFSSNTVDNGACGFRNVLRDIPALPDGFTIGDAMRAYMAAITIDERQAGLPMAVPVR